MCLYDFQALIQKYCHFFSIIDRFEDTTISVFYDFPLTVNLLCSYACCDLSLSALSCCKWGFYLLEEVNGHIGMRNLTDKSAFITYQSSVSFYVSL